MALVLFNFPTIQVQTKMLFQGMFISHGPFLTPWIAHLTSEQIISALYSIHPGPDHSQHMQTYQSKKPLISSLPTPLQPISHT